MDPKQNPTVDDSAGEELAGLDATLDALEYKGDGSGELEPAEIETPAEQDEAPEEANEDQPTADAAEEATGRRSRRDGKKPPQSKVNLTDLPEFREWQANQDRKFEEEKRKRIELERQADEIAAKTHEAQLAQLNQQFAQLDPDDVDQRLKLVDQMAQVRAQQYVRQIRAQDAQAQVWAEYVSKTVSEAGLDPKDFPADKYHGQPAGTFERDLNIAALKELKRLREQASPQAIQKKAKTVAAQTLHEQGFDTVETEAPGKAQGSEEARYERDAHLLQMGRLSAAEFTKRWGDK